MGAMASIKESGRRIPEDISVIGFDDADFAAYCDPPLTTVRIPSFQMGELAMKIIQELKDWQTRRNQDVQAAHGTHSAQKLRDLQGVNGRPKRGGSAVGKK